MRTTYGKLMYLMQDAQANSVANALNFTLYKEILMVNHFLDDHKAQNLLVDELLAVAVCPVVEFTAAGKKLPREEILSKVSAKKEAVKTLMAKYGDVEGGTMQGEDVERVIESIADAYTVVQVSPRTRGATAQQESCTHTPPSPPPPLTHVLFRATSSR